MAMSDCDKCWETPCSCGYGYEAWSVDRLNKHIQMLKKVKAKNKVNDKDIKRQAKIAYEDFKEHEILRCPSRVNYFPSFNKLTAHSKEAWYTRMKRDI